MPTQPPLPAEGQVNEFAGQLLFRIWRATRAGSAEALSTVGLTPGGFALLDRLGDRDGAIQQELSADMGIDPSVTVKLTDELEQAGLAQRQRRAGDRRAWEVSITPAGRRTLTLARQAITEAQDVVLGGLASPERQRLLVLVRQALVSAPGQPECPPGRAPRSS